MVKYQRLGELLIEKNLITSNQLSEALVRQKESNFKIGEELIHSGVVTETQVLSALAESMGLPFIELKSVEISQSIIDKIPARFVTHYNFMPLNEQNGILNIAVNDPLDLCIIDEVKLLLKQQIKFFIATSLEISEAIKKYYGVGAKTMAQMIDDSGDGSIVANAEDSLSQVKTAETEDPSVIKFVNQIIQQAIKERATDVHIEPYEGRLRLRYRIDGVLYDLSVPPAIHHFQSAIIIRIKIMADLDIAEKRLPQDGRIKVTVNKENYDLRISILPTNFGESVEIRILSRKQIFFSLETLGLDKHGFHVLNSAISQPYGIILVTGPTGGGKTTTLYSCLNKINSPERKIITIEDPIEYQLEGITQIQILPKISFTFATGLRSMLRHDPDIMMVGEIRDNETAELAIRTALTGHLVFSTLHTNNAPGAVARLVDMGIEPYLISSSLSCVVAQRLVRLVCPHCKERYYPHNEVIKEFDIHLAKSDNVKFYKGRGCELCKHTGYLGRTAIFEILNVTDKIKEMILDSTPANSIKQEAVNAKMKTLRHSGWEKIISGVTTPEEVIRVTQEDTVTA
ncbi:MAG: type II/IV secretion system protein [Candidatus Omnitrophota bacterium]|nr:MAG: type II/IV secretion system protein [Candidatus Omnitrophota bacterium]